MAVRLHLAQIRVLEVVEDSGRAGGERRVDRRAGAGSSAAGCNRRDKKVRDLEVSDGARCWCGRGAGWCATTATAAGGPSGVRGRADGAWGRLVAREGDDVQPVARRHGVHWHGVRALVDTWSALVAERRRSRRCSFMRMANGTAM